MKTVPAAEHQGETEKSTGSKVDVELG